MGNKYRRTEKKQGERNDLTSGQNVQKSAAEAIGAEHGISERQVRRNAEFAENLDTVAAVAGQ
jgi:hypothetical protein